MDEFIDYVVVCFNSDENFQKITRDKVSIVNKDGFYKINIEGVGDFGLMSSEAYNNLTKDKAADL